MFYKILSEFLLRKIITSNKLIGLYNIRLNPFLYLIKLGKAILINIDQGWLEF